MENDSAEILALGLAADERQSIAALESVASLSAVGSDALPGRLATDRPVCVVAGHDPPAVDALEITERVTGATPAAPVVVAASVDGDGLAADVLAAGATGYVPRRRGPDALREAVADALETVARRRRREQDAAILEAILDQAPIEIYAKDREARHVRSTKTLQFDDVAGKTEIERFDSGRAAEIYRGDLRVLEEEEPIVGELTQYEVGPSELDDFDSGWLRTWAYPWYEGGELRGLVGFTQDVTGVEETNRELSEKNDLLEQFASVVSHDLRNPLNVAQGNLDLARETGDDDAFDAAAQAHDRMAEIIDDLLRLTRDGSRDASRSSVELATEARLAWQTVDTGSATLRVDAEGTVIRADEGLLQQVFENLFRNSSEHGEGDVTVTVGVEDGRFYVADDGPGLPAAVRERVNAGEFNSGGLGVNIVRTIANRHGWGLEASESEDGGARFTFTGCNLVSNPAAEATARRPRELTDTRAIGEIADGEVHRSGDAVSVTGLGRNLWRTVNEFYFAYGTVDGDGDLVARLADFDAGHRSAKAGLMVRTGLEPGAPHGFVGCTRDRGSEVLWQLRPGVGTQSRLVDEDAEPPNWYRLKREGDVVTVFSSADGERWEPLAEQRLPLEERALYGLVVTSHDDEKRATATFEDASLAGVRWE